jgi:hypothetical protein
MRTERPKCQICRRHRRRRRQVTRGRFLTYLGQLYTKPTQTERVQHVDTLPELYKQKRKINIQNSCVQKGRSARFAVVTTAGNDGKFGTAAGLYESVLCINFSFLFIKHR